MREIWQSPFWPKLAFDAAAVAPILARATESVGEISGLLAGQPPAEREVLQRHQLVQEAVASLDMEGINLDAGQLGTSLNALRATGSKGPFNRSSDAIAAVMVEARQGRVPLTADRLTLWHRMLSAGIDVDERGNWRDHGLDILRSTLTGQGGRLFRAPPPAQLDTEMAALLGWLNHPPQMPSILRAALALLWFETIHPFSNGNGWLGRTLIDHVFAMDRALPFALSPQIARERTAFHTALLAGRREGQGVVDATGFVLWFLGCVTRAADAARAEISFLLRRNHYLNQWRNRLTRRQIAALETLLGQGEARVEAGLSTASFAQIAKVSRATATRDLGAMAAAGALVRSIEGGRSTRYWLAMP